MIETDLLADVLPPFLHLCWTMTIFIYMYWMESTMEHWGSTQSLKWLQTMVYWMLRLDGPFCHPISSDNRIFLFYEDNFSVSSLKTCYTCYTSFQKVLKTFIIPDVHAKYGYKKQKIYIMILFCSVFIILLCCITFIFLVILLILFCFLFIELWSPEVILNLLQR